MEPNGQKTILVEFADSNFSEVLIFGNNQNVPAIIKNILDSIKCEVTLIDGFSSEDVSAIKEVVGISLNPHDIMT